jgi:four helix bundle protein
MFPSALFPGAQMRIGIQPFLQDEYLELVVGYQRKSFTMAKDFEELIIWQEARLLANLVFSHLKENTDYGFKNQIFSASVSVMNNIAEGFERYSKADFKRFLQIAKASNAEVISMSYLAEDFNYINEETAVKMRNSCHKIKTGIINLMNTL